jgi:hypothetical protein
MGRVSQYDPFATPMNAGACLVWAHSKVSRRAKGKDTRDSPELQSAGGVQRAM